MVKAKTCYLCGKKNNQESFLKLGHRISLCPNCGLYSLEFEGNYQKFLETYYSKGYFTGGKHYRAYADYLGDKPTILKNMRKYLTVIKKYKKEGMLLDLGCAMGFLLEEAVKWNFDSYGVDISTYALGVAKKNIPKEKLFLGNIEEIEKVLAKKVPGHKFDVITMFDLIEHLENPREALKKTLSFLKDDGLVVIQTGDAGSTWAKIMGKNWHFFAPPQHFYFYNQKTMKMLLEQAGLKVIKIQKVGKWVSLRYLFHMMRYINQDTIGDILYSFTAKNIFGQLRVFMRMNDNMIVLAKKIS
ncbi:class I SAM-dependent methyltransferase [Candidatus Microgenomates bacterium]|nr:class I SAM-dependent methyltransferase [Candidatus Microgenomates bacterium]